LSDSREDGGDGRIMLAEFFIEPSFELRESAARSLLEPSISRNCMKVRMIWIFTAIARGW